MNHRHSTFFRPRDKETLAQGGDWQSEASGPSVTLFFFHSGQIIDPFLRYMIPY